MREDRFTNTEAGAARARSADDVDERPTRADVERDECDARFCSLCGVSLDLHDGPDTAS